MASGGNTLKKSLHAAATSWQPIRGELVANASGVFTFATGSGAVRLSDPRRTILAAGREVRRIPNDDECCHQQHAQDHAAADAVHRRPGSRPLRRALQIADKLEHLIYVFTKSVRVENEIQSRKNLIDGRGDRLVQYDTGGGSCSIMPNVEFVETRSEIRRRSNPPFSAIELSERSTTATA